MNEAKILASVGTYKITEADVDAMLLSLGERGAAYNSREGREMILGQLINQKLLLLDATRNLYEREPEFKAQLNRVKEDMLANYAISKAIGSVRITDEEVKAFFEENRASFAGEATVNASHILVSEEAKANEILSDIREGRITFEEAARQYSSCPSSAEGGCLGDFGQGQMVPEFDQACFSMEIGELRGPIRTQFGYHLIRLNNKGQSEPMAFEAIKDRLKEKLLSDKQQAAYQSKLNQLAILYPVDRF